MSNPLADRLEDFLHFLNINAAAQEPVHMTPTTIAEIVDAYEDTSPEVRAMMGGDFMFNLEETARAYRALVEVTEGYNHSGGELQAVVQAQTQLRESVGYLDLDSKIEALLGPAFDKSLKDVLKRLDCEELVGSSPSYTPKVRTTPGL